MAQLNLLPDIKIEFLRTTRNKRLIIGISLLVIVASVAVLGLLGSVVYVFQKKNLGDLNKDITTYNTQLKNTPELDKVLTIQNQLTSLTGLHEDKAVASRLYGYLAQLTPTAASISQLDVDYSLDVANTYIDTLKFTTYQTVSDDGTAEDEGAKAFSSVVLSQFARNTGGASYTITLNFEPVIFDNASNIKLTVPKIISTRSSTEQPTDLFQGAPEGQQ